MSSTLTSAKLLWDDQAVPAPVLSVSSLSTSIAGRGTEKSLIRNVSFDIQPGRTLSIVGESGSGKSVTALSLLRLLPPSARIAGKVRLQGQDISDLGDRQMADIRGNRIGMIFQEPMTSLNPVLPVGLQIEEALARHAVAKGAEARRRAVELLDKVRIPHAARRCGEYPHQLSGGMRQRVMIAMALACGPDLLIADEPTTALDVTTQSGIIDLLKAIQAEDGTAIMFITHDMGVVAEVADDVLVMRDGEVVEHASSFDIFSRPSHPYTRQLMRAVPRIGDMRGREGPERFAAVGAEAPSAGPQTRHLVTRDSAHKVLSVHGLSVTFRVRDDRRRLRKTDLHAVRDVSFDLFAGETLSVVGESGCGKSTLARGIMGLQPINAGSVAIDGRTPAAMRADGRKALQMVFQDPFASLNPRLTILRSLTEPMTANGIAPAEAAETAAGLMQEVGLSAEMLSRLPHEFSGGQRQRICIARALALKPKVVVADEAVSALDVSVQAQVLNLLMELQERRNLALLFIAHDMAVVERLSHRVAVMCFGRLVEIGPRAAVFDSPAHPYTRQLLSAVPVPDPARRFSTAGRADSFERPVISASARMKDLGGGHLVLAD
ncbi:ABC transporter ATP-binding protein [Frigidibacter sp. MR17.24]|uniref:ABC transporter ATP-binding protein n=1 Tax=Frigidibacter sp. MR17.24 TaxID=3127345 RepID=UPI003012ABCF